MILFTSVLLNMKKVFNPARASSETVPWNKICNGQLQSWNHVNYLSFSADRGFNNHSISPSCIVPPLHVTLQDFRNSLLHFFYYLENKFESKELSFNGSARISGVLKSDTFQYWSKHVHNKN